MLGADRIVAGRYQIMRLLGEGASGRVWLVRDLKERGHRWALKELIPGGSDMSLRESQELISREIRFLKTLHHPGLPRFIDVVEQNGIEFVVMERVEGLTFEQVRGNQGGRIQASDVILWCAQASEVLEYLHTRKPAVIFRDVKPSNLMLSGDGSVRLVDLGIARNFTPSRPGDTHRVGTPGYCPPEQYQGRTSPATDVYAMGATMFHLLTGQDPEKFNFHFPAPSTLVPSIPAELDEVVLRCMNLDPSVRYPTAHELKKALESIRHTSAPAVHHLVSWFRFPRPK